MHRCNRYGLIAYLVFIVVYWFISCPLLWNYLNKQKPEYIKKFLLWGPIGFWGSALFIFIVLSLLMFFMRCRRESEKYSTTFVQAENQTEIRRPVSSYHHDELETVDLHTRSVDFRFVEQPPQRYMNMNDIMIDKIPIITQMNIDGAVDPKTSKLTKQSVPADDTGFEDTTMTKEDSGATCIPIASNRPPPSLIRTELFLYINDTNTSPSTFGIH